MMHGLRFEYERMDQDVQIIARAEDDHGRTWVSRMLAAGITHLDDPTMALAENMAVKRLHEWIG
jgi:hypothetical protein